MRPPFGPRSDAPIGDQAWASPKIRSPQASSQVASLPRTPSKTRPNRTGGTDRRASQEQRRRIRVLLSHPSTKPGQGQFSVEQAQRVGRQSTSLAQQALLLVRSRAFIDEQARSWAEEATFMAGGAATAAQEATITAQE